MLTGVSLSLKIHSLPSLPGPGVQYLLWGLKGVIVVCCGGFSLQFCLFLCIFTLDLWHTRSLSHVVLAWTADPW